jgi:O-antigen/teichoic acid export membrane protein
MLVLYSLGFIDQIGATFFPPVQRAAARGEMGSVRWLYLRQARIAMLCGLPVFVGFVFFGKQFITLWMGPDFAGAFPVLVVLSLSGIAGLFSYGIGTALSAIGHIRFNAVTAVLEATVNVALSVLFAWVGWGLAGVAAGTLAALLLVRCIAQPVYACFRLQLPWRLYVTKVVLAGVPAGGAIAVCCAVIQALIPGESWAMFWAKVACVVGTAPIIGWLLIFSADDKVRFLKAIRFSGARE